MRTDTPSFTDTPGSNVCSQDIRLLSQGLARLLPLTRSCGMMLGMILGALLVCTPLVGVPAAQAQSGDIIYVDADVGGGPGDSWETAFSDLNSALDIATGNDVIVIAEGTYTPGSDRSDRFRITGTQDGLQIYGGWSGTESFTGPADVDAQLGSRDLVANETVLSGDIDANDRPFNPTTDSDGISGTPNGSDHIVGENSYTVVYIDGRSGAEGGSGPITRGTVLNGLTMTGALANVSGPQVGGGGIYCQGDGAECSPTLSRLRVVGNRAATGAGILFRADGGETSPRIARTAVVGNDTVVDIIDVDDTAEPNILPGGGINFGGYFSGRALASEAEIFGSLVAYNAAKRQGGGLWAVNYDQFDLQITNTTFEQNYSVSDGQNGVGGGKAIVTTHDVTLTNVMVSGPSPIETDGPRDGTAVLVFNGGSMTMTNSLLQWGPDDVKLDDGGSVQYLNASGQPVPFDESTNQQDEPGYYRPNSPAGSDGAFATDDDGLQLRDTSPAVGAGIGAAPTGPDLTGASWANGAVSLGAYAGSRPVEPVYVDTDAAPGGDGASWGTAFNELEDALAAAQAGDELWIAEGVYTPDKAPDFPDGNLGDEAFRITGDQDGIQLYGGFSGSETRWDQRAPTTHRSILSGDVGRDDVDPDGDGIIMDASDQVGTNRSVLVLDGEGSSGPSDQPITSQTVIDGLTITAGKDNLLSSVGGGITCESDDSGGCSAQFRNLVIAGNRSDVGGGGMALRLDGALDAPRITNSVFVGNEASNNDGGGVAISAGDIAGASRARLTNVAFVNNRSLNPDGDTFGGKGGAIANRVNLSESRLRTTLTNVTFTGNTAEDAGGALYSGGNDRFPDSRATVTVTNGLFHDNQVSSGGTGDEIATQAQGTTLLTHTLVQGGDAGTSTTNGGTTTYLDFGGDPVDFANSSNQTGDPKFVAPTMPAGPDGTYRTADDGLHLQPNNVARGTGTVDSLRTITTDLTGASRVQGSSSGGNSDYDAIDLGAYEGGGADLALTFYVDAATGDDANKGTSWSGAFATLQAALDAATANDQIWVAEGTYLPSEPLDADEPRTATFEITGALDGLQIYGGFDGTETTRSERDPAANETILSGDIGTTGDASDNAYHVVVFNGGNRIGDNTAPNITTGTELNGVTVTRGNANESSDPNSQGGGIFCDGGSSGNECSPTLANITFSQNAASEEGGALFNDAFLGTSSPHVINSTFTSNSATFGAAIAGEVSNGESNPVIRSATFDGNIAQTSGGAIYIDGNFGTGKPEIENATFTNNEANRGGAIYFYGESGEAAPQITNATFVNNAATSQGGAFYFFGDGGSIAAEIANSIFVDNGADHIAFDDGNAGESPVFINSTFTGATDFAFDIRYYDSGRTPLQVVNSILWGNGGMAGTTESVSDPDAAVDVTYSVVDEATYAEGSGDANAGPGNLNTDPLFVDAGQPAGPDGRFATADDGLRIAENSPAVDAGDNSAVPDGVTTDLIGDLRTQDGNEDGTDDVNLGAYETPGLPIAPSVTITGTNGTENDAGWRVLSVPYTGAVAGDVRMASSAGTNAPRFNLNVMAVWDDSDPDESTGGTGAYTTADASTPLGLGDGLLLYLEDDARDPVESSGLTVSLNESSSATRHGTSAVVRDDLTQSARWHLLGNPYPTDYELSALTTGSSPTGGSPLAGNGFKADAQVYDATRGTWAIINTETETLAAWQGAFIERSTPGTGPTEVTFDPGGRTDASAPFIGSEMQGPTAASEGVQRGTLWLKGVVTDASGDPVATDQAIGVRFHENATDGWDAWDTSKLAPLEAPSVALSAQGPGESGGDVAKAVESRPWPQDAADPDSDADLTAVPVAVQGDALPSDGTLTLQVREWDLPDTWAAELIDTQGTSDTSDDQTVPLEPGMDYPVDVSSLSANPETERFVVQIAPNTGALPVELARFEAQRSGDEAITVQWQTLSETNNAGFEVQRVAGSVNESVETPQWDVSTGESWHTIATLDGAGTTDEPQSYRFEDTDLPYAADSLRYRLRQIDTDGTESFSEPVTIARQVTEAELLPTYPNPARSQATVRFAVPEQQPVRIQLYDMLGRRVQTVVDTDAEGRTEQTIDVGGLASGTYFLRMQTESHTETQRITVVR
ncbi:hypothetical protein CRI93_02855 [Longimonas halophila]|uniref:Secretion system C-terminal sorting domain-containing protein n=1 Tax=Longimonas halophila TaxID=1469170 RepID=A0A2H3NPC1_9BACT|nr:T9SS type A sorting domain-containing protein [Longimonas halophila]PEN08715.1 hypothetical protein CRI93_02855 [Longimonas halophila]